MDWIHQIINSQIDRKIIMFLNFIPIKSTQVQNYLNNQNKQNKRVDDRNAASKLLLWKLMTKFKLCS